MEQLVKVQACLDDGTARVVHVRQSACSGDCHKCAGCGAAQETIVLDARNPIGAKPGELVFVASASGPVLKAAAVLYMLPLFLFFAGYLIGALTLGKGALFGCIAFVLGIAGTVFYDRRMSKKNKTEYTIVRYHTTGRG